MGIKTTNADPGAAYEIVKTTRGATSIKDNLAGEILHNPVGPWREANDLYVVQSGLEGRLASSTQIVTKPCPNPEPQPRTRSPQPGPLVLFDVGLGAGFNALSALMLRRRLGGGARKLKIVSFENNLNLFAFSRDNLAAFASEEAFVKTIEKEISSVGENSPASSWAATSGATATTSAATATPPSARLVTALQSTMTEVLKNGSAHGPDFEWILRRGEFPELIARETEKPEVIFYDPYSPKANPEMWTLDDFRHLYRLASQALNPSILMTYSVSTPVRVTLLLAGFYVGVGHATGNKETTFAATSMNELTDPLGARWLERWDRSQSPLPLGSNMTKAEVGENLLKHRQFDNLAPLRL